jgi:hypothetical protein
MRIKLNLSQLKKIIRSEPLKFPINYNSKDFTDQEFSEFLKLIQQSMKRV